MAQRGLDFTGLLRAALAPTALGGLGLMPVQFWALTPIELRVMLGREGGGALMSRARLTELAARYPDAKRNEQ
ncbi:MAG: phage tail assembly chaperone [Cypionkella sp.]|nr:phage tail assembly chaperone [Cypionkella sp.]